MIGSRFVFATLLAASSVGACVDVDDGDLGEGSEELSLASWTATTNTHVTLSYAPATALLDGVEYQVFADDSGNALPSLTHDLYWRQCDATTCTSTKRIPGQQSLGRVSLAAYNGYIYMIHVGDSDDTAVWFSRLDVTTGTWIPNSQLAFQSLGGAPALAVFNNRLYMVGSRAVDVVRRGVTVTTYPLWYSSMGPDEMWAPMVNISAQSGSPPSLAVLGSTLYLAHRDGAAGEIVLQKLPLGGSWSAPAKIPAGPSGAYIQGDDVQLAAVNGYLHLVHHRWSGNYTYWTYNRGCDAFAPEVSLDGFNSSANSLATGRNGTLVLNRMGMDSGVWPYTIYDWYVSRFIAPPTPVTVPQCGAL